MSLSEANAAEFVAAVKKVKVGAPLYDNGLCFAIDQHMDRGPSEYSAYDIMACILPKIAYRGGFERGLWTPQRKALLRFIKTLEVCDVRTLCRNIK